MNQRSPLIPMEVEAHYLETKESERLSGGHGELEQLRTLEILGRELPPAPAVIFTSALRPEPMLFHEGMWFSSLIPSRFI